MIKNITIRNFKSIKEIDITCADINIFIGKVNSGKSNILETLAFLSYCGTVQPTNIQSFIRAQQTSNLFYNEMILNQQMNIHLQTKSQKYYTTLKPDASSAFFDFSISQGNESLYKSKIEHKISRMEHPKCSELEFIRFYQYIHPSEFSNLFTQYLLPPHGNNLFYVTASQKKHKESFKNLFKTHDARILFRHQQCTFEIQNQVEDDVTNLPYSLVSNTLRKMAFYWMMIESNRNATLVFQEDNAPPLFAKMLAEKIAFDKQNQYFITTHSIPFIQSIRKATSQNVRIFHVFTDQRQTKIKTLDELDENTLRRCLG
ncbi:AAA family ATPase [Candidatus Uabimicrobium amorphum]|uniref:DNA replication and repair protein RecF n=1 Tax=Uabimicrobium amorphum TaxID=2596890 RepID=A0A5S9IUN1_UABAM|nr:AAA family ATPase [Candidatus Uabimicrobium amorphum]BBM88067.1 DNA replication and repair protein RecF [Candidatus Uabimicrobium amorphum]